MKTILMECLTCGKPHTVNRTPEIDPNATSMRCNWCDNCENLADDYYKEWPVFDEVLRIYPVAFNQLYLPLSFPGPGSIIEKHFELNNIQLGQ